MVSISQHKALTLTVGVYVLFVVADLIYALSFPGDNSGHSIFHLFFGTPFLLLGAFIWIVTRSRQHLHGVGTVVLIGGLVFTGTLQYAESIGAFAYDGYEVRNRTLWYFHWIGGFGTVLGFFFVVLGLLLIVGTLTIRVVRSRF